MGVVEQAKQQLRAQLLEQRSHYTAAELEPWSLRIHAHLCQWQRFQQAQVIHTFVSRPQEPDTQRIIQHCWQVGKRVIVPYVLGQGQLGHSLLQAWAQLAPGRYGILEPKPQERQSVDLQAVDLVLVPGLAFDRQGGRLGHGQGFYDQFLANLTAYRVGLAFAFQVVLQVPQQPHDQRVQAVLTEEGFLPLES